MKKTTYWKDVWRTFVASKAYALYCLAYGTGILCLDWS